MGSKRIQIIDAIRGFSILGMVIYHFAFDLSVLNLAIINFDSFIWTAFARVIQFTFLFLVGVSTSIICSRTASYDEFVKRQIGRFTLVGLNALLITLVTWVLFPAQYISFGILHLIAVSIAMLTLMATLDRRSVFILSVTIIVVSVLVSHDTYYEGLSWLGFYTDNFRSLDYFPILPWLSVPLLGFALGDIVSKFAFMVDSIRPLEIFAAAGRHSLLIYMIHQPILYVTLMILSTILAK